MERPPTPPPVAVPVLILEQIPSLEARAQFVAVCNQAEAMLYEFGQPFHALSMERHKQRVLRAFAVQDLVHAHEDKPRTADFRAALEALATRPLNTF